MSAVIRFAIGLLGSFTLMCFGRELLGVAGTASVQDFTGTLLVMAAGAILWRVS